MLFHLSFMVQHMQLPTGWPTASNPWPVGFILQHLCGDVPAMTDQPAPGIIKDYVWTATQGKEAVWVGMFISVVFFLFGKV